MQLLPPKVAQHYDTIFHEHYDSTIKINQVEVADETQFVPEQIAKSEEDSQIELYGHTKE